MTRKRFVKLLMAERFDKNVANLWADYYNMAGVRYADAYKEMAVYRDVHVITEIGNRDFKNFQSMACEIFSKIFLSLADVAEEAQKSFRELGNTLREVNI